MKESLWGFVDAAHDITWATRFVAKGVICEPMYVLQELVSYAWIADEGTHDYLFLRYVGHW